MHFNHCLTNQSVALVFNLILFYSHLSIINMRAFTAATYKQAVFVSDCRPPNSIPPHLSELPIANASDMLSSHLLKAVMYDTVGVKQTKILFLFHLENQIT